MTRRIAASVAAVVLSASRLHAADVSGEIGVGAIYSDNILLVPSGTQGGTIGIATTDFLVHEQTRRLEIDVAANLQYLTYEHHVYSNELLGDLTGYGKFALVPSRIEWVLQDNFGQQQITPGLPVTPLNLENINYVSTGPDVNVPLGPQLQAMLSGRYSNVSYQLNDLNNNRGDVSAALVHPLSATSNVSLDGSVERVDYDGTVVSPDYTITQGYLHYDAQGSRSKLTADLGYDDVLLTGARSGGALVRADLIRKVSASSSLELSLGQNISDVDNLLRQMEGTDNVTLGAAALQRSQDPFVSRYATGAWHFERHRTGLALSLSQFRETHIVEGDLDRTRTEFDAIARRDLAQTVVLNVAASYARDSYLSPITPNDHELRGTVDLGWHVGRRVQLHAQYARIDHRSDVAVDTYKEDRFMLTAGLATGNWSAPGIGTTNPVNWPAPQL